MTDDRQALRIASRHGASRFVAPAFAALLLFGGGIAAKAAELLMFEQKACPFCERFNREIAPDYARSGAGAVAPLRHVDIYESRTGGIEGLDPAVFTPTFVLIDGGHEVGRLLGYPGRRYFYPEIQSLIDRLPAGPHARLTGEGALSSAGRVAEEADAAR